MSESACATDLTVLQGSHQKSRRCQAVRMRNLRQGYVPKSAWATFSPFWLTVPFSGFARRHDLKV